MSEELPKYKLVKTLSAPDEFIEKVNALADINYRVHTYATSWEEGEHRGAGYTRREALMSLKSDSKYENIEGLKDVQPSEVDQHLAEGWVITDSYSKFIRMVRPKVQSMNSKARNEA